MLTIFIYSLMCYGIANAIVYYSGPWDIFVKLRNFASGNDKLEELFSCMFCLPTNIGIIMSIISFLYCKSQPFTPFTILFDSDTHLWPLIVLFDGFYTGAIVSIIDAIVNKITGDQAPAKGEIYPCLAKIIVTIIVT